MFAPGTRGSRLEAIRFFDIRFWLLGLTLGAPLLIELAVIDWFDTGSPSFRQKRVGRKQQPFRLVKFRTMRPVTASVAMTSLALGVGGQWRRSRN